MVMLEHNFDLIINIEGHDDYQDLNPVLKLIDYSVDQAILYVVIEGKDLEIIELIYSLLNINTEKKKDEYEDIIMRCIYLQ